MWHDELRCPRRQGGGGGTCMCLLGRLSGLLSSSTMSNPTTCCRRHTRVAFPSDVAFRCRKQHTKRIAKISVAVRTTVVLGSEGPPGVECQFNAVSVLHHDMNAVQLKAHQPPGRALWRNA